MISRSRTEANTSAFIQCVMEMLVHVHVLVNAQ